MHDYSLLKEQLNDKKAKGGNMKKLTISIDFDGVLNMKEYPETEPVDCRIYEIINAWIARGHTVILNTCREGKLLQEAIDSMMVRIDLRNENTTENIEKFGGDTRKIFADVYIDDRNILQIGKPIDFELYDRIIRRLEDV